VRTSQDLADAGRDFVADDDRLQKFTAVASTCWPTARAAEIVGRRVVDGVLEDVVDFCRVGSRAWIKGRLDRGWAAQCQPRRSPVQVVRHGGFEQGRGGMG
jgi:hypothetical protein